MHSDSSVFPVIGERRLPGEDRDLFLLWAPAFAGVTRKLGQAGTGYVSERDDL
jgi:hypothetical protein